MSNETMESHEPVVDAGTELELAGRWQRFAAAMIDGLIMTAVMIPVMFITGGFGALASGEEPGILYSLLIAAVGIGAFVAINGKLLVAEGQTIGKRAMNIRIVTLENEKPAVKENLIPRYALYFLLGQLPFLGQILSLINVCMIFAGDRRCGHDHVGATKVVACS